MTGNILFFKIFLFFTFFNSLCFAQIEKITIRVPVHIKTILSAGEKVKLQDGTVINEKDVYQDIIVNIYKNKKINKGPYLIFNHGTVIGLGRANEVNSKRFETIGNFFSNYGFITIIPIRAGYGESGGAVSDFKGSCLKPKIIEGMNNMVHQNLQVLQYIKNIPYINLNEGLIAGQSGGGGLSIAMASENIPGLKGVINFAGALKDTYAQPKSASSKELTEINCASEETKAAFKYYGSSTKVPSLWLYSINDRIVGITKPMEWFQTFQKANYIPKGKFEFLQSYKLEGHGFMNDANIWVPQFNKFLEEINFSIRIK